MIRMVTARTGALARRAAEHPVGMAAGLMAAWSLPLWTVLARERNPAFVVLYHGLFSGLAAMLLWGLGWREEAGFTRPACWRSLRVAALPLAAVLLTFRSVHVTSAREVVVLGALALLVAFQQEICYRGILLQVLRGVYGVRRAVFISAALFASLHGIGLLTGAAPGVTLVKVLMSGVGGFVLAALRVKTGAIWPGLTVNWLFQVSLMLGPISPHRLAVQGLMSVILMAYALSWLRSVPDGQIEEDTESDADPESESLSVS